MSRRLSPSSKTIPDPSLPELITYAPLVSSIPFGWKGLIVERYQRPPDALSVPPLAAFWLTCYLGESTRLVQRRNGQLHHGGLSYGDSTLTAAGSSSDWEWDTLSDNLHIGLTPEFLCSAARQMECPHSDTLRLRDQFHFHDPRIQNLAMMLLAELETPQWGSRLSAEALGLSLAVHLLRTYAETPNSKTHHAALSRADLRRVTDYIHANLAAELSIAEVSAVVSLSPYHFCRCFKQTTGQSLHQYVIALRLDYARCLLQQDDLSVAEIAVLAGFYDQSHLTAHFKRVFGMTPKQLRSLNRTNFREIRSNFQANGSELDL